MKKSTWFAALVALILAATVALADVSFAQSRGQGMGRRGQGGQAWCQGGGPGNPNCPNYPAYRKRAQGWQNNPQARRGRQGNRQVNPPAPQNVLPETTQ
jgi:opacity protein-like surface antigen